MICQHAFCCEKADTTFYIFITSPLELHSCSECFIILFELKELICGLIATIHEGFNVRHPVVIWNREVFPRASTRASRRNLAAVFYLLRYLKELLEKLEVRITQSASISVIISGSVEIVRSNCETIHNFLDGRLS